MKTQVSEDNAIRYSGVNALHEHLFSGQPITYLEAQLLLGFRSLTVEISRLRKKAFVIKSRQIPMARALRRINGYIHCTHPSELPINSLKVTEYYLDEND